jgi:hypothetical protein
MGFHLAMYLTLVAAIAVAVVRAVGPVRERREQLLTGMLAWSGVFGLVAAGYYAGRSDTTSMVSLFSPWCFSVVLLVIAVGRGLAARGWKRVILPELLVLFGLGLAVCSVVQVPSPWSQVGRLRHLAATDVYKQPKALRFIGHTTRPGEQVAIMLSLGHRIAYDLGLDNVVPYSGSEAMPAQRQMQITLAVIREHHIHKVFFDRRVALAGQVIAVREAGYSVIAMEGPLYELADGQPVATAR